MRTPKTMRYDDVVLIGTEHRWGTTITGVPRVDKDGKQVAGKMTGTVDLVDVVRVTKIYHRSGSETSPYTRIYLSCTPACGGGGTVSDYYLIKRAVAEKFATPCKKCYR